MNRSITRLVIMSAILLLIFLFLLMNLQRMLLKMQPNARPPVTATR